MTLLTLLAVEFILFLFSYESEKRDWISPGTFSIVVFFVATFFAIIGNAAWNMPFSVEAELLVILGLAAMLAGQFAARLCNFGRLNSRYAKQTETNTVERIELPNWKICSITVITLFLTALYVFDVLRAGRSLGASGLSAINAVRRSSEVSTNTIIRQGIKFIMAASFVDSYIFVNNSFSGKIRFKDLCCLVPAVCGCICSLFTGVRTEILRILFALFVCYWIILKGKKGWKKGVALKTIKKVMPAVLIATLVFVQMKDIVKGGELATNKVYNVFEYVAYYIGTPVVVFGTKVNIGPDYFRGTHFGEISFNSLWEDLGDWGVVDTSDMLKGSANIMINAKEKITANVDTILGSALIDFGVMGMVVFIFICYFLLSYYYYRFVKYTNVSNKNFHLIVYSFLFVIPGMAYYANLVGKVISVYFLLTYIMLHLIYWFYFKLTIKVRFRR